MYYSAVCVRANEDYGTKGIECDSSLATRAYLCLVLSLL